MNATLLIGQLYCCRRLTHAGQYFSVTSAQHRLIGSTVRDPVGFESGRGRGVRVYTARYDPPPLIVILLWHHFCFYKRHYIQLIALIALPVVLVLLFWTAGTLIPKNEVKENLREKDIKKLPTSYGAVNSLAPVGPFDENMETMYAELHDFYKNRSKHGQRRVGHRRRNGTNSNDDDDEMAPTPRHNDYDYYGEHRDQNEISSDATLGHFLELCGLLFQPNHVARRRNTSPTYTNDARIDQLTASGVLLFYPDNTESIRSVISIFQLELSEYLEQRHIWYRRYNTDKQIFKRCYGHKAQVRGFRTYTDALHYAKTEVKATEDSPYGYNPLRYLWAILDLTHFSVEPVNPSITYDFIYDEQSTNFLYERGLFLQDSLERAIVRFMAGTNNQSILLGVELMPLPNKCWIRSNIFFEIFLKYLLALLIIGGFALPAVNCVNLMITERHLRLREYMLIMGVGRLYLKFSWALFFLLFIAPLSIIVALLVAYLPGNPFGYFDQSLLVVVIILYNIAQLTFCFLLTSVIKTPGNTGVLTIFLLFFSWIIAIFMFNNLKDMRGTFVIFARLMSLVFTTPLTIAGIYVTSWGEVWLGAKWSNLFQTPVEMDKYGGIGMCIVWLVFDCILYATLSWYVDRAFPGDFGQRHPFYFFLLPSFWCPGKYGKRQAKDIEEGELELSDLHRMNTEKLGEKQQLDAGIEIDNLTMIYPGGIVGVKNLSIQFPKNFVTAFLGHNGAGKSTTMNTIVGLLTPTNGTIYVNGKDTKTNMQKIKKDIAFVPQYDILYPDLTLDEHLRFYGWLKGMSKADIEEQLKPLLDEMDLAKAVKTVATNLSGGQKRKLSMVIAYLGSPSYIILDEPTSGVDPFSRRFIWNMILSNRRGATTILSTHQMDEADLLADRIAIISAGSLQCFGTSFDLKNQYGSGFQLILALEENLDPKVINQLQTFVAKTFGVDLRQVQVSGHDITAIIPLKMGQSQKMVGALHALDRKLTEMGGQISYGVSEPTLEDVFFKATDHGAVPVINAELNNEERLHLLQDSDQISYEKQSGISWLWTQVMGQLEKRFQYSRRSIVILMYQIILPVSFIAVMLMIGSKLTLHVIDVTVSVQLQTSFYTNIWFYKDDDAKTAVTDNFLTSMLESGIGPGCAKGSKLPLQICIKSISDKNEFDKKGNPGNIPQNCSCGSHCTNRLKYREILPKVTVPTGDVVYGANEVSNNKNDTLLSKWVYAVNGTKYITMGGFHFRTNETVRLWSKPEQMPAVLNGFNNILARSISGNKDISLTMNLRRVRVDIGEEFGKSIKELAASMLAGLFILLAFAFSSFGTSYFIMYEKERGLKRLQFIAGANRIIYWLVNFIWDYLFYCFTTAIILLLLCAVKNFFTNTILLVAVVTFPYGLMIVSFIYLLSFLFKSQKGVVIFLIVSIIICLFFGSTISIFENVDIASCRGGKCITYFPWAQFLGPILRLFPPYYIMDGLTAISMITAFTEPFMKQERKHLRQRGLDTPEMSTSEELSLFYGGSVFQYKILGKYVITGIVSGILYLILTVLLENFMENCSCSNWCNKSKAPRVVDLDEDVKVEEAEIRKPERSNDPLQVRNITKYYSSMPVPAVNNVTFGMRRSQCFGLLGVNGAGKTTLFRMITGYLAPSSGTAIIEQMDMYKNPRFAERKFMYCPQDNTMYDCLTVREHLGVFAKFLSIPRREAKNIIEKVLIEVDLKSHENKLTRRLSGGNQRKLQFALAIMGYPSIIFLDEPTSGMDPGARRSTWKAIQRAIQNRGCSVMLTSHSMEECEALCHRLVIMVAGNLQCIGSIQYLKNKFGNRYTIKSRLNPDDTEQAEMVKTFINEALENKANLVDEQATQLHYEIDSASLPRLSFIFELMHKCRQQFGIESFSVSQVKLEHVFTNMAQKLDKSRTTQALPNTAVSTNV